MNSIAYARKRMIEETNQKINELNYPGNIGLLEISNFYMKAKKNKDLSLINKVEEYIKKNENKKAWEIILDYLGVTLQDIK
jgi:C-terminal processing protease CtpA/Prc